MARKALVDGSQDYKERRFPEAEQRFRDAVSRDPNGETVEGRTAQLFLARTLHSSYIGNRQNKAKAEEALQEYKKALSFDKNDQSSYKAVASLLENLQRTEEWQNWVTERANSEDIKPQYRAEALVSLAAKQNTCANDITDTEQTKKTITKDGKQVFQFVKPANEADYLRLKQCIEQGNALIDRALALETDRVKNARNIDAKGLSDSELREALELIRVFESARSYKASLLVQAMRLAEMEGRAQDRDRLKQESEAAKESFLALSEKSKELQNETDARAAAKEAAENPAAAGDAGAGK